MRTSKLRFTVVLCITSAVLVGASAQDEAVPAADPGATVAAWTDRLEALRPALPLEYFELAEEIADVAETNEMRDLARRLFGLAGLLDSDQLGRSACLALADLESSELGRRRLLALASLLGDESIGHRLFFESGVEAGETVSFSAALAVTKAFSHYRRGEGSRAIGALREPGAMDLLIQCDPFIRGGVNRFLEDCKLYRGQLRPSMGPEDVNRLLRLEIAILSSPDDRPWSSELLFSRGQPLIEVDPERIEATFGVDASQPIYRNQRWVER